MGPGGQDSAPGSALGSSADLPGSGARPSCAEVQAPLLPPEGGAVAAPLPLSPLQRNREGAEVGLGLYAEQPDPRHPV